MIGCWMSFGIRNVQLTFADLGRPESDLLQPNIRLVFTGLLAVTLGLIFTVGMVQVEVGGLKRGAGHRPLLRNCGADVV